MSNARILCLAITHGNQYSRNIIGEVTQQPVLLLSSHCQRLGMNRPIESIKTHFIKHNFISEQESAHSLCVTVGFASRIFCY